MTTQAAMPSLDVNMSDVDIDAIDDEDVLKHMWQATEDFADKRRIRARMYKLREKRLKDFYMNDEVMTATPSAASLPSRSASYSYSSTTTTDQADEQTSQTITTSESVAMETESRSLTDQKRRNEDEDDEDAVSEKIRRKSSVRTKRYQQVMSEIDSKPAPETTGFTSSNVVESSRSIVSEPVITREVQKSLSQDSLEAYETLKTSTSRREWTEGDVYTCVETTETFRKLRESGVPLTQRVTLTKTIRKRISDGVVLEENEDEVIDDMDGEQTQTAVDVALRRSSVDQPVIESPFTARRSFTTGGVDADSLEDIRESSVDATVGSSRAAFEESSLNGESSFNTTVVEDSYLVNESATADTQTASTPTADVELEIDESGYATIKTTKRTTESSKTSTAAKRRADSAELKKSALASSPSRTGLGGINRSASRTTTQTAKVTTKSNTSSSIPRPATSTPRRKEDDDDEEGVKRSPSGSKVASSPKTATSPKESKIPMKAEPKSKLPAKRNDSFGSTGRVTSSVKTSTVTAQKVGTSKPMMTRTVETTRTVSTRENDKPWRTNSATSKTTTTTSRGNKPSNLHSTVLNVVEKYVDSEGCAIHGHHHHHHDEKPDEPVEEVKPEAEPEVEPEDDEREPVVEEPIKVERPSLLFSEDLHDSGNKKCSKLTAESPVLGSPSVVMKARNLFHSDSVEEKPQEEPVTKKYEPLKRESSTLFSGSLRSTSLFSKETVQEPREAAPAPSVDVPVAPVQSARDAPVVTSSSEGKQIEEIEDLTLLENMLNTATNYDDRSRIRAHIRIVKKKLGPGAPSSASPAASPMLSRRNVSSAPSPTPDQSAKKSTNPESSFFKSGLAALRKDKEPEMPAPVPAPATTPAPVQVAASAPVAEPTSTTEVTSVVRKSSYSYTSSTTSSIASSARPEVKEAISEPVKEPEVDNEEPFDRESSDEQSSPKPSRAPWRRQSSEAALKLPTHLPEPEAHPDTLDITSSYGTGPMDENGRPLFGLGALRRRPKTPNTSDNEGPAPQPIVIDRSQPLSELQKLHESQIASKPEKESEPVEKPKAKLRNSYIAPTDEPQENLENDNREPIISERSQTLRDIIRIHEKVTTETAPSDQPLASPKPKAKLKDTFFTQQSEENEKANQDQVIERSEAFQSIVQRHQQLSSTPETTTSASSPPLKRPGILKKPKDWSPSSSQDASSPTKDERRTSVDQTTSRRTSVESSIEIQLNAASQSSSKVYHEIPANGSGITMQYNTVQDVKMAQQPRKLSVDVEPSPIVHSSSVNLPTTGGMVLTGDSSGHSIKSTSTFQLQKSSVSSNQSTVQQSSAAPSDDPTPWRRKSIPREPSVPKDEPVTEKVTSTATLSSRSTVQTTGAPPPVLNRPSRWAANDSSATSSTRSLSSRYESNVQQSSTPTASPVPTRSSFASRYEANIQSNNNNAAPAPSSTARSTFSSRYESSVQNVPAASSVASMAPATAPVNQEDATEVRKTSTTTMTLSGTTGTAQQNRSSFASRYETSLDKTSEAASAVSGTTGTSQQPRSSFASRYEPSVEKSAPVDSSVVSGATGTTQQNRGSFASRYETSVEKTTDSSSASRTSQQPRSSFVSRRESSVEKTVSTDSSVVCGTTGITREHRSSLTSRYEAPMGKTTDSYCVSGTTGTSQQPRSSFAHHHRESSVEKTVRSDSPVGSGTSGSSREQRSSFASRYEASVEKSTSEKSAPVDTVSGPNAPAQQAQRGGYASRYESSLDKTVGAPSDLPKIKTATGSSVRALAQKFIQTGEEKSQPQVSKSTGYPKAGLIFRSNSFRSQTSVDGGASSLVRSGSLRASPARSRFSMDRTSREQSVEPCGSESGSRRQSTVTSSATYTTSTSERFTSEPLEPTPGATMTSTTTSSSNSRSFLQDRTPVRGMQDIIGRMRASDAPTGQVETDDSRSLSLLNKLIGAQILVQCTEQAVQSAGHSTPDSFVTCTEERAPDGSRFSRTVTSGESGKDGDVSWTKRSSQTVTKSVLRPSLAPSDDQLDNCNDYETRRKIRARIKALIGDKADDEESAPSVAKTVDESVMDWVRRQAAITAESGVQINPLPEIMSTASGASALDTGNSQPPQEGEVFDSGTESGEDSTTQSNHSQSDLNSFMADLAKLSLENPGGGSKSGIDPNASPQEFLRQVDSVLDRLKSSLNTDDSIDCPIKGGADQALHQHLASGDKQLKVHPNQQSELISLIDRLQSSLHNLQSDSQPQPIEVKIATPIQTVAPPTAKTPTQAPSTQILQPNQVEAKTVEQKEEKSQVKGSSVVKLRAQSFAAAASSKPVTLARPSSFYRSPVSSGSSVRSSSEPASPNPSPVPHKVQLKAPDFLSSTSTAAPSHKPIWCQVQPANHSKIVLEKSGIRGRFVPPDLNPVTVQEKKTPVHQVQPAVNLHRVVTPSVRSQSQPPLQRLQITQPMPQTAQPEPESPVQSPKTPNQTKNLPWKVKLAKKKQASNSSLTRPLDGATSVDLRNTIKLAAHRKSMEDLSSATTSFPLLKQKSLGELYTAQPKPFVRSESVGAERFKPVDLRKLNFSTSRSSSTDRASDWSTSAPPTPMSPEAPVVVSASIGPSSCGNWVMTSSAKKPATRQESVASSTSETVPADEVVTGVLKLGQKDAQPLTRKASSNDLSLDPSAELFTPAEMAQIAIHKAAIKASLVQQVEDRRKSSGCLDVLSSLDFTKTCVDSVIASQSDKISKASQVTESVQIDNLVEKADKLSKRELETSLDPNDPSANLFTPAESLQIAIHKAAIKASLSQQEEARKKVDRSSSVEAPREEPRKTVDRSSSIEVPQSPVSLTQSDETAVTSPKIKAPPPDDPSSILFTPAESLQIAIHKAAIKASLTQQEEARKKSVDSDSVSLSSSQRSRSSRSEKSSKSRNSAQKAAVKSAEKAAILQPAIEEKPKPEIKAPEVKSSKQPMQQAKPTKPVVSQVPEVKALSQVSKSQKPKVIQETAKPPEMKEQIKASEPVLSRQPEIKAVPHLSKTEKSKIEGVVKLPEVKTKVPEPTLTKATEIKPVTQVTKSEKPKIPEAVELPKVNEHIKAPESSVTKVSEVKAVPSFSTPERVHIQTSKLPEVKMVKQRSFIFESKSQKLSEVKPLNEKPAVKAPETEQQKPGNQLKNQLKDKPRRSNTIALLEAPSAAPSAAPSNKFPWQPAKVNTETDRKLQELFKRNADQESHVASYRPRVPVQSKLSNIKKTFENQPAPERRSSDTTDLHPHPHVTSGQLKVHLNRPPDDVPVNRAFIPAPHPLVQSKQANVFVHHEQAQPIHVKVSMNASYNNEVFKVPPEQRLRLAQAASARAEVRLKPEVKAPLVRDRSTEYVTAVTYSQSINPAIKPEVRTYNPVIKADSSDSIRMRMTSELSSSTSRIDYHRKEEPVVGRITVQPQPVKQKQPHLRRVMKNRSCSSVRTQSSLRSDSKDSDDDDKDSIGIIGDDEASSSDDLSSDDEAPVRQQEGLKTLTKILKKHSDEPLNPPLVVVHSDDPLRRTNVTKSYSSREINSLDHNYGISRAMSSTTVRPSLALTGLNPEPYIEPEGPTLVGLVARNVARRSSSSNSVHSSNVSLHPSPTTEHAFISKSVSSSRLVTEAKSQLERREQTRPKSLIIPSPTEVRRVIGNKQYEASLSPDSAEKKQREVMAFFDQNQRKQQQQSQQMMFSSTSYSAAVRSSSAAPVMMVNPAVSRLLQAEKVPFNRQSSFEGSGSDVDEVFNRMFADNPPTPDVRIPVSPLLSSSSRPADTVNRNSFGSSTVQSRSEVTVTRQSNFTRGPGGSAFSKFQQLDQSVKSSTSNNRTVNGSAKEAKAEVKQLMPKPDHNHNNQLEVPFVRPRLSTAAIKERLLKFCQRATASYKNVQIENFSTSWNDGMAFCALIHHYYPDAFDFSQLEPRNRRYNFTLAFKTAEDKAGIAPLLDVDDMVMMQRPDWKCVFTYVQSFYRRFKDE